MATNEELMAHIAQLSENQRSLMEQLNFMKNRPVDPFTYYKTPDPIKNISLFSGNRRETLAWIEEVEDTLELFKECKEEPIYPQLIRAVKSKITGEAREILIAAGNPSDWIDIKDVLLHSYGDKRDLASHIQSLFYITLGKKTITEYFNKLKQIDTAIKSTANSTDEFKGATKQINAFIGLISTTRYVDGLGDNLSMIVRSHKPESLEEAHTYAMQYSNAAYRQKLEKNNIRQPEQRKQFPNPNIPTKTNSYPPGNRSDRFKAKPTEVYRNNPDEDVSMRTHRSKAVVNNHEGIEENQDPPPEIDSEDDDYFISDELNFQQAEAKPQKT